MCQRFNEWSGAIRSYCEENGLSFERAKSMVKCSSSNMLALQYFDPNADAEKQKKGLLDETPMPVVLWVFKENGSFVFKQTEFTKKYLLS